MKALLIAAGAVALATPALAQMATTTPQSTKTQTAPASPAAPAGTSTTMAVPSDPKALIASEFPSYDKDANGALSKDEFATWIGLLKAKTDTTPTPAAEMTKYTDGAFATADTDKSKSVTLVELQTYLTAGA